MGNRWGNNGNSNKVFFLGSKTAVYGDCIHEIGRCLLLGRKAFTNLDSILKRRDITLLTKVYIVKAMIFPVVMYGCERRTIKKADHWRTDAFKLVLGKTLENPLDSKEIKPVNPKRNQPWIFIGRTDAEVEALILWPPDRKSWIIEGGRSRGWQRMRWLNGITDSMAVSLSKL